ncbi:MAG: host-nuclease inhibitor Gam family protein [Tepidisphaeraceae bacterium]
MGTAQTASPRPEPLQDEQQSLPIIHAVDAETDVELLRSLPRQFQITDEKTANWLVKRIQQSREYAARVKAWAEQELRRAAREEATLNFLFGRQIESWAKDEIGKFNGRRKSLCLPAGTVGFRSQPTRLVVDDETRVISWARQNLPSAIVVVEKLSKTTLNEYTEKTGDIPDGGVHVEVAQEKFFIR